MITKLSPKKIALLSALAAVAGGCTLNHEETTSPSPRAREKNERALNNLQDETARRNQEIADANRRIADTQRKNDEELNALRDQIADLKRQMAQNPDAAEVATLRTEVATLQQTLSENEARGRAEILTLRQKITDLRISVSALEKKVIDKISAGGVAQTNMSVMQSLDGHTQIYQLKGRYNTLVIPVEFSAEPTFDGRFKNRERFVNGSVQEEIFGNGPTSMHTYYQHASGGLFDVSGQVVAPVRVDKPLTFYGKAVAGNKDEHARELVVDALKALKQRVGNDENWWKQFDRWDLNDLDSDGVYSESDGFLDAVVLVYAGKEQAACQSAFDPKNSQPGSDDVSTDDPRHDAAVECYNRLWPHRSSLFLSADSPDFPKNGPIVEGQDRGAMGIAITRDVYAFDYNMQSEYSDVSTFIHEFGHSLTLPDTYALQGENNVGRWDIMASNARNFAQEQSSYHRIALGWLSPKIIEEGQPFSAYLGNLNYTSQTQRENLPNFTGPLFTFGSVNRFEQAFSVVSEVPESEEPVYRSLLVRLKPSLKKIKEVDMPSTSGSKAAYTGRFDGSTRKMSFKVDVPTEGDAKLSFDTIYFIETETNFNAPDADVRVVTDYDIGTVTIDGAKREEFRTISGDKNFDTLNESNPDCAATRVLELRSKLISKTATAEEKKEFKEKRAVCVEPTWVQKSYDLSALRGKKVDVVIAYATDAGYNEFGIFVDNIKVGANTLFDFEDGKLPGTEWVVSSNGERESTSNQLYLLEYRDPQETFGNGASYNMDQYIQSSRGQAAFLPKNGNLGPRERFRLMTPDYQPGVLGWLLDTQLDRRSNTPESADHIGHGYYLPVNNELREVTMPGVYDNPELKDDKGFYNPSAEAFGKLADPDVQEFKCFGYSKLAEYLEGKAPNCAGYTDIDGLNKLRLQGRLLIQVRDSINNYLPLDQRSHFVVADPFSALRSGSFTRAAIQTFRPADAEEFLPLKVWKAQSDGNMVIDEEMTAQVERIKPMSKFEDTTSLGNAPHLKDPRFVANRATVPSRGFSFEVVSPDANVLARYNSANPDDNNSFFRRPRAKVIIRWDAMKIQEEWR